MADNAAQPSRTKWPYNIAIPQRFSSNYHRYQQRGGLVDVTEDARLYTGNEPLRDVERLFFLSLAFDQIHKEGLEGDFAELGVYQGSTAAVLARHAQRLDRRLYLLDTYEGFDQQDFNGLDAGRSVAFTNTSLEAVRARVGEANVAYVKGYFPQTAEQLPIDGRYCLVHIDTDLYAPIISGLEYFYPRMVPGGFLIIHDYGSLSWDGAEKAVDNFFADKPESVVQIPDSCGSAVVRRLRTPGDAPSWIAKRQLLARDVWHSAANGQLVHVLDDGWSSPEAWGTWGVGNAHRIKLVTDLPPGRPLVVDFDIHAFVWDSIAAREVDVLLNGQPVSTLALTKARNFVELSLESLHGADENNTLAIEFRPRLIANPSDVAPPSVDGRQLGVALHRLRIRGMDPAVQNG